MIARELSPDVGFNEVKVFVQNLVRPPKPKQTQHKAGDEVDAQEPMPKLQEYWMKEGLFNLIEMIESDANGQTNVDYLI